uniref:PDZ domain-containing protein n=1 Tax=Steinernema glaseri TaxID=37863 RepID=A0A1I7YTM4_9BILA
MESDNETSVEVKVKTPITEKVTVVIDYEENDNLGLTLTEKLVVNRVQKDTKGDGKFAVGDQIFTVNGRQPNNVDHFYQLIRNMQASYPQMTIEVNRRVNKTPVSDRRLAKINYTKHKSYDYFVAHIYRTAGTKLGLSVKNSFSKVVVMKVDPDGLCAGIYNVGDFILDVDGIPVMTKELTKQLLLSALESKHYASTVVERIKSDLSLRMQLSERFQNDPRVSDDVVRIGKRAAERHRQRAQLTNPPIVRQPPFLSDLDSTANNVTVDCIETIPGGYKFGRAGDAAPHPRAAIQEIAVQEPQRPFVKDDHAQGESLPVNLFSFHL